MADLSNVQFNPQDPDALFSPDQWTNAYSQFSGKALPWPSSYTGYPTDAMGNYINPQAGSGIPNYAQWQAGQAAQPAATPGTTINSMPAQSQADTGTGLDDVLGAMGMTQFGQQMADKGISQRDIAGLIGLPGAQNIMGPQQAAPQAAPAPPSNNLAYPQVLSMLANPGKVTTPGANVPVSPTSAQPSSGALQSFMQNFKPAQSGPGAGFQQNFSKTLKGMGYWRRTMGLFDALQGMMGRPDPSQQLYAALGQGPGQPGNPAGAQPGQAPPGAPNAGGGPPGAAAGPQVYQSPPDLAQAYQALAGGGNAPSPAQGAAPPPDLAQMYMAMQQREQQKQGFWGGLAGVAKALHPGRVNSDMMQAIRGPQDDTGSLFNNIVQLQQYQQQNQALQAYRQSVPQMLKGMGLSDDQVKAYTPLALADPSFGTKIAETQLGVGGSPAWMAQKHAEAALTAQGKPIPWTPGDPVSYDAYTTATTETSVKNATDITTAKNDASTSFNSVDPQMENDSGQLLRGSMIRPTRTPSLQAIQQTGI